jgi:GDP-D-mannose dehydratase
VLHSFRERLLRRGRRAPPAEVDHLVGDASRAEADLGWETRVSFRELVEMMVAADLDRLSSLAAPMAPSPHT